MKTAGSIASDVREMEEIVTLCCGRPQGDELPQVATVNDVLMDVYSDILNMPREYAAGRFHHQYNDGLLDDFDIIH